MKKRLKKSIAFLLSIIMIMTMLLNGTFVMTASAQGETSTTGVTFEVVSGSPAGFTNEGHANLVDNDTSTKWCCGFDTSAYVVIKASEPIYVSGYTISTGNDTGSNSGRNPKVWTLSACIDYNEETKTSENWTVIDDVTDGDLPAANEQSKSFTLTGTPALYRYFKLDITQIVSGSILQISEFAFTYTTCEHQWGSFGDKVDPDCVNYGYTPQFCSVCGYARETDIVDALGHNFENNVCTRCGVADTEPQEPSAENGIYQIGTLGELNWFAGLVNGTLKGVTQNKSANAVLTKDIFVNKNVLSSDGTLADDVSGFTSWTPIGNAYSPYIGTFDGAGYTVSGLYFNDTSAELVGLFGYVGENGTVRNVGVVDSYFNGDKYIGGVCGRNGDGGTITNCYADVTVNGSQCIGGVCGHNRGIIANCYSTAKVSGTTLYGGVCGFLINGTIINCYYDKTKFTGNAVGYQTEDYTVTNVYGITTAQFASGMAAYKLSQGCKVGEVTYDGSIWGQEIGKDKSPVLGGKKVYATTGCVSYNNDGEEGEKQHNFVDGVCTECGNYKISNATELASFAAAVNGGNNEIDAILTADITVNNGVLDADGNLNSGEFDTWTPIGDYDNPYNGTFDGQNHTISGLYINDENECEVGLFGYIGENGTVCNVGIVDSYFNGEYGFGGVCSSNDGTVTNCFVRGTLYGYSDVGGLCAANYGTVTNCYAVVTVSGTDYVGGVCGYNEGTITNCCVYGGSAIYDNSGTADNVFSKSIAQFKSGEVAYLLNQNDTIAEDVWGQTIGTDDYPVLGGANVYVTTGCVIYTNDESLSGTVKEHGEFVNGMCPDCGEYKAAEEIDGVYQISKVSDLYWLAQTVNNGNTAINAVLTADITVNENVLKADGSLNSGEFDAWTPIGNSDNPYNGKFDGKGHTVSGLYFNDSNTSYVGLFGNVGEYGTVCNVGIVDSYFNGYYGVGGLCGYNKGTIKNCYNTGIVSGSDYVGGVCGFNIGQIGFCYYDSTVYGGSAIGYNYGTVQSVLGKTTAKFKRGEVAYLLNGDQSTLVWGQTIGTDKYPVFHDDNNTVYATTGCVTYSNDASISGTAKEHGEFVNSMCPDCGEYKAAEEIDGVYQISKASDLYWFVDQVNSGNNEINAVLTADITVNENVLKSDGTLNDGSFMAWTPIGDYDNRYNGTFDGAGHTISGLYFNNTSASDIGFIGCVGVNGVVSNVGIVDSYINANGYAGGVCGDNLGKIINCYNSSTVSGKEDIGGVCGYNENGTITNCYNTGTVNGANNVGGVCGEDYGTITNCYYLASVESDSIGGTTFKTAEQFASGEVCYLLNGGKSDSPIWYQNIDNATADASPVLDSSHGIVYLSPCTALYSNTDTGHTVIGDYDSNGFGICSVCNADIFKPATQNESGVYEIYNAGQLYWFADRVNSGNTSINAVLMENIIVNQNVLNENGELNEGSFKVWTTICNSSNKYTGTFDGAGHTISGLYFNNTIASDIGFIGCVGSDGVVSNVGIVDSYLNGASNIGAVCGDNDGTITNCNSTCSVNGSEKVGGVCGYNIGTIENGSNTGSVNGTNNVGGVCGYNDGTIKNCNNEGIVSGTDYVGGVCGYNYKGTIESCNNEGTVNGSEKVGGVCGDNDGTIENCNNEGSVKGTDYVGGVCGYNGEGTTKNCSNTGTVIGNGDYVGGVCGYNWSDTGTIIISNNTGTVKGVNNVGGVCGYNDYGEVTNCHNEGIVSGTGNDIGGVCGNNYKGTITDCHNTGGVSGTVTGSNGHICVGGVCGYNGSTIENCYNTGTVTAANQYSFVGGVCGLNYNGKITNCYNAGGISGLAYVGGVCGNNWSSTIANCYNTGTVGGTSYARGVCGTQYSGSIIENCYYLAETEDENGGKAATQFESGEVAYLLSQGCTIGEGEDAATYDGSIWGQNIDNGNPAELYPVLGGEKVYKIAYKNGESEYEADYANAGEFELPVSSLKGFVAYSDNTDYLFAGQKVQIESDTSFNIVTLTINMMNGASMRMNEKTGIRFYSQIDTDLITALRNAAENAGVTISLGTMISKKSIIGEQDFTKDMSGQLVDVKYKAKTWYSEDEFTGMVGSIVNIKESNYNEEFVGRGYVTVTYGDVTTTVYADYDGDSISNNSRSICYIANQIMLDQTEYEALSAEKQQIVKDFADKYTGEDKYNQ